MSAAARKVKVPPGLPAFVSVPPGVWADPLVLAPPLLLLLPPQAATNRASAVMTLAKRVQRTDLLIGFLLVAERCALLSLRAPLSAPSGD
jgi:hypothetical protein